MVTNVNTYFDAGFEKIPEKVLSIYNAVEELAEEGKDVTTLKVSDIAARAGIGKGTVYEYFESREEVISQAVFYNISKSIGTILCIFSEKCGFKERFYKMLEYIWSKRLDENATRSVFEVLRGIQNPDNILYGLRFDKAKEMSLQCFEEIEKALIGYLEEGREEGAFTESNSKYAKNALCSQVIQFLFFLQDNPNEGDKEKIENYVYEGLILLLKR